MSKLGLVIVLILMAGRIYAQDYFALIEADDGQPFYVRVDSQLYSSSARGHLILSRLKDSSYIITVGFPGQVFPERQFSFNVHQNDHAFRLKNEDGKGWWLVDDKGQELATVNGNSGEASARIPGIKKDDAFSRLMADVVKDTAVMYSTYTIEQATPSPVTAASVAGASVATASATPTPANSAAATPTSTNDSQAPAIGRPADTTASASHGARDSSGISVILHARDSSAMSAVAYHGDSTITTPLSTSHPVDSTIGAGGGSRDTATTMGPASTVAPVASTAIPLYRTTGVTMLTEHRSSRSLRQVYTDYDSSGKADTVVIIIPLDTPAQTGHPAVTSLVPRATRTTDSGHLTALRGHGPNPDTPALSPTRTSTKSTLPFVNSDCHNFATDYDVDKLRVKMLESAKDDDRILAAHKVFKTKCFSTRQIRALSEVFTSDAAKFRFLEAAYPFVSDDHFAELSNLLTDPVYSGRFRAMTDHP